MTPFTRFLAFEAVGWAVAAALLVWGVEAELFGEGVAWALFVVWVVKDFALYPLTKAAYEHDSVTHGSADLIGAEVVVEDALDPEGYVRAGNERWRAELAPGCAGPLEAGASARVSELRGITLVVEPASMDTDTTIQS